MSFLSIDNKKLAAIAATACAGVATGCLTFVSAVDVRSFLSHVKNDKVDVIKHHFPVWWPYGRDLMIPVLLSGVISNIMAFRLTNHVNFAYTASLIGCIGPYTGIILGEDIEALRKSNDEEVGETARRFCKLHHVRLVAAAAGFGMALVALAEI
mmetsp:Transcript_34506/g.83516  ORF Transcript_34506/g.83516 Transcript_34506/m.83516 type:complete len:154 (-) Transcript_34506:1946-2407(-)